MSECILLTGRVWDALCILLAGLLNLLAVTFALIVFIHRRVKGHTDEALDMIPDLSVTMSSCSQSVIDSKGKPFTLSIIWVVTGAVCALCMEMNSG